MKAVDVEEKLLGRRRDITRVLSHLKRDSDKVTGSRQIDWLDQASDQNTARTGDRLREIYGAELYRIERALERIRTGAFGFCAACHGEIEPMRLEACPDAEFCFGCAAMREAFVAAA
jgi:RNA polymerase-binding transcription factor DksA